jgi:hypothetical protein
VATDFDALAFDTTATGQFLPIPRRDDTPESPFLSVAYELPSYVGDARTYGNGEPFTEGIPTLGAILGSTLIGIDKSAGPINWVSMTREYYINRPTSCSMPSPIVTRTNLISTPFKTRSTRSFSAQSTS